MSLLYAIDVYKANEIACGAPMSLTGNLQACNLSMLAVTTAITNSTGSGHTVYYDASSYDGLDGATCDLVNGGTLTPAC